MDMFAFPFNAKLTAFFSPLGVYKGETAFNGAFSCFVYRGNAVASRNRKLH